MSDLASSPGEAAAQLARECAEAATPPVVEALAPLRDELLVVTGGTGFVGTWLAELVAHLNDAHAFRTRVTLVARRTDGFRARSAHLASRPDVELVEQDIRDLVELPADTGWLVHAAGSPDNRVHASDPVRTLQTFVHGTDAVMRTAARLEHLRRVLHLSSGLVYGSQPLALEAVREDYLGATEFDAVVATYPEAKRAAETVLAAHRSANRLNTVTVRPFAFLGPVQALSAPWAVNNFLQDALHGGPIRILGNAATVRSYLYPTDMAVWLLTALVRGRTGAAYNVGSQVGVTLRELADRIAAHAEGRVEVTEGGRGQRHTEPSRFLPDVSAARSDLGVTETVDLDAAIRRTLAWHRATSAERPATDALRAV
ncbi:MAG: NAD-dependent epimerase/dehydratase family protein [Solirubrobacteraceae bacterium]